MQRVKLCNYATKRRAVESPVGRNLGEISHKKTGKIRENGKKKGKLGRKWEACQELAPADGKGWLRPWFRVDIYSSK